MVLTLPQIISISSPSSLLVLFLINLMFMFRYFKTWILFCYQHKNNKNQYCWLWQKATRDESERYTQLQTFLDQNQYTTHGIKRYEKIYGKGFVSSGGQKLVEVLESRVEEIHTTNYFVFAGLSVTVGIADCREIIRFNTYLAFRSCVKN